MHHTIVVLLGLLAFIGFLPSVRAKLPADTLAVAAFPRPPSPRFAWLASTRSANDAFVSSQGGSRIAYGTYAKQGQFPYAAKIWAKNNAGRIMTCGGALILPRVVLTAAHCVTERDGRLYNPAKMELVIGVLNVTDLAAPSYFVRSVIVPSTYDPNSFWGDLALLHLYKPAASPARPVALASSGIRLKPTLLLKVIGWGESHLLRLEPLLSYATLAVSSPKHCDNRLAKLGIYQRPEDHFCTSPDASARVSCPGDSGGPFLYRKTASAAPVVVGLVSFGPNMRCGEPGNFDVATSIVAWRKWIDAMVSKYNLKKK